MDSMSRRSFWMHAAAGSLLSLVCVPALAHAAYPDHVVRLTVPYPPGGTADFLGRILTEKLARSWGQSVIVDNKSGAGGRCGTISNTWSVAPPQSFTAWVHTTGPHWRRCRPEH